MQRPCKEEVCQEELLDAACQKAAKKAIAKAPKAKAKAPKAKAKRPLPLAPIGSYRDGSPRLLTPRAAKKPRVIQDSSDEEDSSNDSEAADTLEAGRF